MRKGKLHLIPTTLGESDPLAVIPNTAIEIGRTLTHFIVENERTARRFLKSIGTEISLNDLQLNALNKHTVLSDIPQMVKPLLEGLDMGLMSEAGLPAIADPGAIVVAWCHANGIEVKPYAGPSSIILGLIASGFNGQKFTFHGYLPIDSRDKQMSLKEMERAIKVSDVTQIFMETPFRNEKLLAQVLESCHQDTFLCVACDITLSSQYIKTDQIKTWRSQKPNLHKRPCIYLLGNPQ
jgi:16S rRNA (cytidine1402-2'-O)-methyltransferase